MPRASFEAPPSRSAIAAPGPSSAATKGHRVAPHTPPAARLSSHQACFLRTELLEIMCDFLFFFFFWKEKAGRAWVWGRIPVRFCLAPAGGSVGLQSPNARAARGGKRQRERTVLASPARCPACATGRPKGAGWGRGQEGKRDTQKKIGGHSGPPDGLAAHWGWWRKQGVGGSRHPGTEKAERDMVVLSCPTLSPASSTSKTYPSAPSSLPPSALCPVPNLSQHGISDDKH